MSKYTEQELENEYEYNEKMREVEEEDCEHCGGNFLYDMFYFYGEKLCENCYNIAKQEEQDENERFS